MEQPGDRGPDDPVALVLEAVDLDPVAVEALEPLEVGERVVEQLDLLDDDRRLLDRGRGRRLDPVQDEGVGGLLDEVEDVVEGADQGVDVLAVERRDEGRLEPMADLVADLVAAMLGRPDLGGPGLGLVVGPEHRLEEARAAEDVRGVLDEQVEEPHVARDQAETQGRSSWTIGAAVRRRAPRIGPGSAGRSARTPRPTRQGTPPPVPVRCSRPMDWIFIGFVGLLAIALAVAVGLAIDRDRQLEAPARRSPGRRRGASPPAPIARPTRPMRAAAAADRPCRPLVRRLRDRLDASEFELDQQVRNASYLADLMGVGIVRLDDARHASSWRTPRPTSCSADRRARSAAARRSRRSSTAGSRS